MDWLIAFLICLVMVGGTVGGICLGFRMGRQSIDKPLPPVVHRKQAAPNEEDPYWKPMTGEEQPSYPTIKEG